MRGFYSLFRKNRKQLQPDSPPSIDEATGVIIDADRGDDATYESVDEREWKAEQEALRRREGRGN